MSTYERLIESANNRLIWCENKLKEERVEILDESRFPFIATGAQLDALYGYETGLRSGEVVLVKTDGMIEPYNRALCARYIIAFKEIENDVL